MSDPAESRGYLESLNTAYFYKTVTLMRPKQSWTVGLDPAETCELFYLQA